MRIRPARPYLVDALIALAETCAALLLGQESTAQGWPPLDATGYLLLVLAHLPVALRSRAPLLVFGVVYAASFAYVTAGYWPVASTFGIMLGVYTVASLRAPRLSVPCAVLMGLLWIYAGLVSDHGSMLSVLAQALLFPPVLWRFGLVARRSAELARRLRVEQAERARRLLAEERGRIARELHDVVAHHMSVISVQAGLARFVFDSDPPTTRRALGTIAGTSGEALDELRRMLRVLREEQPEHGDGTGAGDGEDAASPVDADGTPGAPGAPMPGLARLGDLVERVREVGVPVELRTGGTPRPLPSGTELCAYRVVQEALTNVIRHAGQARAVVELRYHEHHLTVSVTDDGKGDVSDRVPSGSGHGLIGMRERAKLYGGTIRIGPRTGGGFGVELTLPIAPGTARQGDDADA